MAAVVAFDLDDTLFSEWEYVRSGYRAVAREIAKTTGADAATLARMMMEHRPLGFEAVLDYIKDMPGADRFSVDSMVETYRAHTPLIPLRPGAREMLTTLKDQGATLVLITDGSTRHQRAKFHALGLDGLFAPEAILISEETGGDKRTPVPWALTRRLFGRPGTHFFYVGDNLSKDFRLANMAGWTTIMLRDAAGTNVFPQRPADWPAINRPSFTIDNLSEIINITKPCL